ncbi:MFS transporter [Pleomorphomonas diazotrophica]|uniref:MFS transporter n=1 Tax=Pleomorphomonas diazotrophica TaxID=1166257 RepID=A0A1I4QWD9_9HYPH|nr:DHA2 family efflux MFS transporter permease subunit [Pleomorphomonas diazotrophica]PKR90399.1 MFS transporter [Pleomorphomonas diazotrophica]SFM44016.1 drug resistance transporter, EmrB/QacA subfamily [Pleomorphomonas diazotrophica]
MLIPLIVACALFMENLDSSVVSTSLPQIAIDLGVDPISLKLAFTSYLISVAVFLPISGWMADRFGARTVFRLAILVFVTGSVFCGLSSSLEGFVAARIVQGAGGAMMVPVGRLVMLRSVRKSDYLRAMSWLTVPAMIGPVLGPPLGGFITTYFEWRWIFWINIPISIVGLVLVSIYIKNYKEENLPPLDTRGFLLSGVGLAGFVFGIAASGIGVLPPWIDIALVLLGAAALYAYARHALRTPEPLMDLTLFRLPTFRVSVLGGLLFRIGVGAIPFLLPLLLQLGFGMSPFESGMLTFATAAGAVLMKFTAPRILRAWGFRMVLMANTLFTTAFLLAIISFTKDTSHAAIFAVLLIGGFFRSLQFTALNGLAFAEIDNRRMSHATSISSVGQQISAALGVAVGAAALEVTRSIRGDMAVLPGDFVPAFLALAVIGLLCIPIYARMSPNAGSEVSGHRAEAAGEPSV